MPTQTHTYTLSPQDKALWLSLFAAFVGADVTAHGSGSRLDIASSANIATKAFGMTKALLLNPPSCLDTDALAILEAVMSDDNAELQPAQPHPTRLLRAREWAQVTRVRAAHYLGMTPEELEAAETASAPGLVAWTTARLQAAARLYSVNDDWLTGHGGSSIEDARRKFRDRTPNPPAE